MPASFSITAQAAASALSRSRVTVVCSVLTAQCPVRRCKPGSAVLRLFRPRSHGRCAAMTPCALVLNCRALSRKMASKNSNFTLSCLRRARRRALGHRALGQRLMEGLTKDDEAANEGGLLVRHRRGNLPAVAIECQQFGRRCVWVCLAADQAHGPATAGTWRRRR